MTEPEIVQKPAPAPDIEQTFTKSELQEAIKQAVAQERQEQKRRKWKVRAVAAVVLGGTAGVFYYAAQKHRETYGLSGPTYTNRAFACMYYENKIDGCPLMSIPDVRMIKEQAQEKFSAASQSVKDYASSVHKKWFGSTESSSSCTCPKSP